MFFYKRQLSQPLNHTTIIINSLLRQGTDNFSNDPLKNLNFSYIGKKMLINNS